MVSQKSILALLPLFLSTSLAIPTKKLPRSPYGVPEAVDYTSNPTKSTWYSTSFSEGQSIPPNPAGLYNCYDGLDLSSWPSHNEWLSFEEMWKNNLAQMKLSNTEEEIGYLQDAIKEVSDEAKLDARLILAIVMQESTGKVHVPCQIGPSGSTHCGLMQAPNGSSSFDPSSPQSSIKLMISDGVFGISSSRSGHLPSGWPGLKHYFNGGATDLPWIDAKWSGNPYAAARLYNSGTMDASGNLNVSPWDERTGAYANDVANRLVGWTGEVEGCKKSESCVRSESKDQTPLRDPKLGQCT